MDAWFPTWKGMDWRLIAFPEINCIPSFETLFTMDAEYFEKSSPSKRLKAEIINIKTIYENCSKSTIKTTTQLHWFRSSVLLLTAVDKSSLNFEI